MIGLRAWRRAWDGSLPRLRRRFAPRCDRRVTMLTRHTAVLTESVRDDVRIVADGLAAVTAELVAVSAKIDALKR